MRTRLGAPAALLAFGAVLAAWAVYAGWGRDFASFYWSAAALAAGENAYQPASAGAAINLNPPHVTLLFVPLTLLPFSIAFGIWQFVQLCGWSAVLRASARSSGGLTPELAAAAAVFPGTLLQLALGQWGFLLAWMVAAAWLAQRRGRHLECGAWLGLATAIKPFVGLLALVLARRGQMRGAAAALGIAACAWAAGIMWLGTESYVAWRDIVARISWAAHAPNASLRGLAERAFSHDATFALWLVAAAFVLVTTVVLCRKATGDAVSWTMALTAALLVSPLGWLYYGWIVAPSLLALRRWPSALKAGLVLLWIPPGLLPTLSTGTLGLLLVWTALASDCLRKARVPEGQPAWP